MQLISYLQRHKKQVYCSLGAGILMLFICYVYLVNQAVMHVVARENAERTISELSAVVGSLELNYIAVRNEITLAYAEESGFNTSDETAFVARRDTATQLSLLDSDAN